MYVRKSRQLGAILLISGTTIGAGMLALPAITAVAGFFPSLVLLIVYWILSVITALLLLEVNLWFKGPANLITMSKYTLGKKGEMVSWILYLLLLYALTAAYLSASGPMFFDLLYLFGLKEPPQWTATLPFLFVFGSVIALGTRLVDYLNRALMAGLFVAYCFLIALSFEHVQGERLTYARPEFSLIALPVILTSFGFQIVIPSLTHYLHKNVAVLKRAIIIGSLIPLVVYLLWEYVAIGSLPRATLIDVLSNSGSVPYAIVEVTHNPWIASFSRLFSFCAVVTSFLGVGLSLSHFLADGFRLHPNPKGRALTLALTFLPPLVFVLFYPQGFIAALEYAGVIVALLLGILPCIMVWRGRRVHQEEVLYRVFGGNALLSLCILIYLCVIFFI